MDHELYLALSARNLAQARDQGYEEIIAPCAACYHRLVCAEMELARHPETLAAVNARTGLNYGGGIAVLNMLDYFTDRVGLSAIGEQVRQPLKGLRVACYYGCLNSRIPHAAATSGPPDAPGGATRSEYPMSMDHIVAALGAQPLDWSYKTECCGASLFVTASSVSARLVGHILKDAVAAGADCISVACPMCQNNLDTKQDAIRAAFGIGRPMPVLFITQLMGLAFGVSAAELRIGDALVPFQWRVDKGGAAAEVTACPA